MIKIFSRSVEPSAEPLPNILQRDLEHLYFAVAPRREFDIAAATIDPLPALRRQAVSRRLAFGLAALIIAGLGAIVVSPTFRDSHPKPVSAAGLIEKARSAAQSASSFYRVHNLTMDDAQGSPTKQTFAVWFRDAEHWKAESFETNPQTGEAGRSLFATVRDGRDLWYYYLDGESLRVINRDASVVRVPDWSLRGDLESALSEYGPGRCTEDARVAGTEEVAGRTAYRIEFAIDTKTNPLCGDLLANVMWLDTETFLPVKTQDLDKNGGSTTSLMTHLELGLVSDEDVSFVPPSGTWVNYQDRGEVIQVP